MYEYVGVRDDPDYGIMLARNGPCQPRNNWRHCMYRAVQEKPGHQAGRATQPGHPADITQEILYEYVGVGDDPDYGIATARKFLAVIHFTLKHQIIWKNFPEGIIQSQAA